MNAETERMLADIPDTLKARGWRFVKTASRMSYSSPPACVAIYVRRYEPGVDDARWSARTSFGFVRVTTDEANHPTWAAARAEGIEHMHRIDDTRMPT